MAEPIQQRILRQLSKGVAHRPGEVLAQAFLAPRSGLVQAIDAERIGGAAMVLGAGRTRVDERIDHAAGLVLHHKVGQSVQAGAPLATLHCNDSSRFEEARGLVAGAYFLGDDAPPRRKLIYKVID